MFTNLSYKILVKFLIVFNNKCITPEKKILVIELLGPVSILFFFILLDSFIVFVLIEVCFT